MNDIEIADLEIATQLEEGLNEVNPESLRIKAQFFEDMVQSLNPKQNKIEMRAIFRHQLDEVIRLLHTEDTLHKLIIKCKHVAINVAKGNAIDSPAKNNAFDSASDSEYMAKVVKRKRLKIASARTRAQVGKKKQANAMLSKNKKKANSYKVGDIVLLKVIFLIV